MKNFLTRGYTIIEVLIVLIGVALIPLAVYLLYLIVKILQHLVAV